MPEVQNRAHRIITQENRAIIEKWLPNNMKIGGNLYRATEHGFEASKFHETCDHKVTIHIWCLSSVLRFCKINVWITQGPTLTIVRCTEGNIFGGYNAKEWASDATWNTSDDNFIFTIKNPHSLAPEKLQILPGYHDGTWNSNYDRPTFGGGYDLYIGDMSNLDPGSFLRKHTYRIGREFIHGKS